MTNKARTLLTFCSLIGLLGGCNTQTLPIAAVPQQEQISTAPYKGLRGTWVRYGQYGFTMIEITDTAHVLYHQVIDRREVDATTTRDRYWFYKSNAKMGYPDPDSTNIYILTDNFRFDYRLEKNGDLTEHDKMGSQGTFVKMPAESEG